MQTKKLIGLIVGVSLVAASCGSGKVDDRAARKLMKDKLCTTCHTVNGSKTLSSGAVALGPTLKGIFGKTENVKVGEETKSITVDDAYLRRSITEPNAEITEGYEAVMAPGELTDDEVTTLVEYLKTL